MIKLKLYKIIANAIDLLYHSGMSINEIVRELGVDQKEETELGITDLREQLEELDREMGVK
jgi:hypothetical protein